jgi:hypothetical protein
LEKHASGPKMPIMYAGLGKSTVENYLGSMEPASHPWAVHIDSYSSSIAVTLIEGYNNSVIFTDSNRGLRWQYGMATKDETLEMSKMWYAEISDICENYPLIMVVRDTSNNVQNTSKELNDFFTSYGGKNYFTTSYRQWHNELAESSVGSVTMLGKTEMAES